MNFLDIRREEKGISVIALIVAILLLGSIGYIMSSLMIRSQESTPRTLDSARAFYLTQGGVEFTGKYLQGVTDWTVLAGSISRDLGTGNFVVAFSGPTTTDVTATITGNAGSAHRQIVAGFHKTPSGGVSSRGGISMVNSSWIDCEPSNPSNINCTTAGSCACARQNVSSMPPISVPGGLSPPPIGCSYVNSFTGTIPAGTYVRSSGMSLTNSVHISISGPVTIFTTTLSLINNSTLNAGGSAANLLVIASGTVFLPNGSVFTGALYAPGSTISLVNNGAFNGVMAGNSISFTNSASFNYYQNAGSTSPYYIQTGAGGTATVSLTGWQ